MGGTDVKTKRGLGPAHRSPRPTLPPSDDAIP
jgi:hypothetical protein